MCWGDNKSVISNIPHRLENVNSQPGHGVEYPAPQVDNFSTDIYGLEVDFSWVSWIPDDTNKDILSCSLDPVGDGETFIPVDDCFGKISVSHIFENGGNYIPRLIVTDSNGNTTISDNSLVSLRQDSANQRS